MTHRNIYTQTTSGIALLMTMMVLSVVLAVTLTIVELTLKQLALSVDSRDSEIAFHAANAGLECARYTRRSASTSFERGSSVPFKCFGVNQSVAPLTYALNGISTSTSGAQVVGWVFRYQKKITWSGNRCSDMDIVTMVVSTSSIGNLVLTAADGSSLTQIFPGYTSAKKSCAPGGVCTIASVSGYSVACGSINSASNDVLKRQVLLEF